MVPASDSHAKTITDAVADLDAADSIPDSVWNAVSNLLSDAQPDPKFYAVPNPGSHSNCYALAFLDAEPDT